MNKDKPYNCTCSFPNVVYKNYNGHHPSCPVYIEWYDTVHRGSETADDTRNRLVRHLMMTNAETEQRIADLQDELDRYRRNHRNTVEMINLLTNGTFVPKED